MTLKIGTNQSDSVVLYDLLANEHFLLPANVVSQTTGTFAINAAGGGHNVTIEGTLIGDNGIALGGTHSDFGNNLAISATGVIAATTQGAVYSFGEQATINNAGLVAGRTGFIFLSDLGTGTTLVNSGRIIADYRPVEHSGAERLTFTNSGVVTSYGIDSYSGSFAGIDVVINKGTMTGDIQLNGNNDTYEGNGGRVIGTVYGDVGSDSLRGGAFADRLTGNSGNDYLTGRGGRDILSGGADVDHFYYNALAEVGDTITDFTTLDFFHFKSTSFGGVTNATLPTQFVSNATGVALDGNDRFVYNTTADQLWFDSNGNVAGGRTLITDFSYDVALTRFDIMMF